MAIFVGGCAAKMRDDIQEKVREKRQGRRNQWLFDGKCQRSTCQNMVEPSHMDDYVIDVDICLRLCPKKGAYRGGAAGPW